eukprot:6173341-Pleurochrysis_carterae.AAC.1
MLEPSFRDESSRQWAHPAARVMETDISEIDSRSWDPHRTRYPCRHTEKPRPDCLARWVLAAIVLATCALRGVCTDSVGACSVRTFGVCIDDVGAFCVYIHDVGWCMLEHAAFGADGAWCLSRLVLAA